VNDIKQHLTPSSLSFQGQIGYVGFSQGTLAMFYLLAERPELAEVIRPVIQIAPIMSLKHARHPIRSLSDNPLLKRVLQSLGEVNFNNRLTNFAIEIICRSQINLLPFICGNMMKLTLGHHGRLNYTRLPVYLKHFPDSTSALNVMHFSQMIHTGQLRMFNFENEEENRKCYGSPQPPEIDYSKIRSEDIHLIYSLGDMFSDVKDIEEFKSTVNGKVSITVHEINPN
jgi:lysosomal acid lipase/cholesteryl ester hydrolase